MELSAERLVEACGELSEDAGITIETQLEPLAGPGAPVKPAVYAGGVYQVDRRWWGDANDQQQVDAIVVDNVPSQANRLEAALEVLRPDLGLPELVLDLSSLGDLPPHLPRRLSSFRFPHRHADAYLRDAEIDGAPFLKSDVGKAIFDATANQAMHLMEWFPQTLLYGFWQSHLGKKRSQAKLARSWISEIVGYHPASDPGDPVKVLGVKGDGLNLSKDEPIYFDENAVAGWPVAKGEGKKGDPSDIGHGQVPFPGPNRPPALAPVSFAELVQRSTVSVAALRRVHVGTADQDAAARALLVSLGLVAHAAAFGRGFSLRSGCELRPMSTTWTWLGGGGDESLGRLSTETATTLFRQCVGQGEAVGLPVGSSWPSAPLVLEPNKSLRDVIRKTWPEHE